MENTVLINGHETRLNAWKRYLNTIKPINEHLVECEQLERWKLELAEKRLKKILMRKL